MKFRSQHVRFEGSPGAAGAAAGTGEGTGLGAAGTTQPPATQGAGASTGEGGHPGSASALSTGSDWSIDRVPEKFRVTGEDGQIDTLATFRKVAEHRDSLERRMGEGGIRPKTADEYKLPESDFFKSVQLDEAKSKIFRERAHALGLSQAQYEGVMSDYATQATELVAGVAQDSADTTISALRETWGGDFDTNMRGAFSAANALAEKAGIPFAEVEQAMGNNPTAIRLLAALSKEMGEDKTPVVAGAGGGASDISALMSHPAYTDQRHPEHAAISKRVQQHFEREAAKAER